LQKLFNKKYIKNSTKKIVKRYINQFTGNAKNCMHYNSIFPRNNFITYTYTHKKSLLHKKII
ncbi:unnamed protein product, partial [Diamesa hyperborea]